MTSGYAYNDLVSSSHLYTTKLHLAVKKENK